MSSSPSIIDPLKLAEVLWPHYSLCEECTPQARLKSLVWGFQEGKCPYHTLNDGIQFYGKQKEILESVWENDETICVAGNVLGKDFIAGYASLAFFLTREPCRIVTTSVDYSQLESVLWGEMRRFIQTSKYPLDSQFGGPLLINHLHIRKIDPKSKRVDPLSYLIGRVSGKGEGMLGHHVAKVGDGIPRTMIVCDEASGIDNEIFDMARTWCNRMLVIGNPFECHNYFKKAVKGGDIKADTPSFSMRAS